MWPSEWSGERIVAAVIVGGCTLTAALLKAYVDMRGARSGSGNRTSLVRRVRGLAGAIIAGGGVVFAALLTAGFLQTPDASALVRSVTGSAAPMRAGASGLPTDSAAAAALRARQAWLQTQGTTIYYRYTRYLPNACPNGATAHGSWADGVEQGVAVRCLRDGWLAFDIEPLAEHGRIVPNITYCLNFRDASGVWGRHAALGAPGFERVSMPAVRVPLGRAVGFRYVRATPFDRVVLTQELPRAAC